MSGFQLQRLGLIMEPEPGSPQEVEGVLNPAAVRGPDGHLYLFKRIGVARLDVPERLPSGALANGRGRKSKFPSAANRKEDLRRTTGSCDCGEQHRDGAEHRTGIPAMGQTTRVQE
jgi:hypothetical protein